MFTGIIEEVGRVLRVERSGNSAKIRISANEVLQGTKLGDSIAVNGVCLTVVEIVSDAFVADATPQTLDTTNLGLLKPSTDVNLERALTLNSRLGGHIVTGHIDEVCTLQSVKKLDNSHVLTFATRPKSIELIVDKGSVAINGISLTVASVGDSTFSVSVIPHSFDNTNLKNAKEGDTFNLEYDILGKYVRALLAGDNLGKAAVIDSAIKQQSTSGLTLEFLRSAGF